MTYLLLFNSMQIGLVRFLKHVVSLIKCFRLKISQKAETVASVGPALRSPINLKLSYLDDNRSNFFLPRLFKCSDINDFFGLYVQQRTYFYSHIDFGEKSLYCYFSYWF